MQNNVVYVLFLSEFRKHRDAGVAEWVLVLLRVLSGDLDASQVQLSVTSVSLTSVLSTKLSVFPLVPVTAQTFANSIV